MEISWAIIGRITRPRKVQEGTRDVKRKITRTLILKLEPVAATQRAETRGPLSLDLFRPGLARRASWEPQMHVYPMPGRGVQSLLCFKLQTDDKASPYFLEPIRLCWGSLRPWDHTHLTGPVTRPGDQNHHRTF
ncbi:hypothetical protein AJ79_04070 [Helicocarpus griseus UAMH5409]|uniref:Uncharacterized protein n=1 Tax=Helicocarpus griseus UAMH5409 TaxID=1447875 RepID=A0A2B7XUN6_9EURO|nr:hypothetical protein AJ79_04070 [Helicocarpus griseus UAMH5409]